MKRPNVYQLSVKLGECLSQKGWTMAVAESCTGGGLAYAITSAAGSSHWFERGLVTYSNQAKIEILGVSPQTIARHGAVSLETAEEMALGVIAHSHADIGVSITGIAGPAGGTPQKPVGTVFFGLAVRGGKVETSRQLFNSGRKHVRDCAIGFALEWLISNIR